jgi:hypothetical protein
LILAANSRKPKSKRNSTPRSSERGGVLNDAVSIYFLDATLAGAFVARWCAGHRVETAGGVFQVSDDDPAPRIEAGLHRTP